MVFILTCLENIIGTFMGLSRSIIDLYALKYARDNPANDIKCLLVPALFESLL